MAGAVVATQVDLVAGKNFVFHEPAQGCRDGTAGQVGIGTFKFIQRATVAFTGPLVGGCNPIRQIARDLDLLLPRVDAIIAVPTVREADGLARSSRNALLAPQDRAAAAQLPSAMQAALVKLRGGADVASTLRELEAGLVAGGFAAVDYAELRDAATLAPIVSPSIGPARLFVAARIGGTRLIDNMPL